MDRFEAMSILVAVADAGSLSAASRKLGTPLATVSRKLAELEAHLQIQLLSRSSRRMSLTDAGRSYVEASKGILEQVAEAERAATGEYSVPKGHLTLTAPVVFGRLHVLPLALEFLRTYPEIDLRLVQSDRLLDLQEGNIDLALRIGHLANSGLIATRVGATRRVVCASPAYLAARGRPGTPADLGSHDCIAFENLTASHAWTFRNGNGEQTVPIRCRLTLTTAEAAIDAAVAGLGMTRVLSYMVEDARRAGALEFVLEAAEPEPWPISLVYPGQKLLPLKLRAFLDWMAPRLKARLA